MLPVTARPGHTDWLSAGVVPTIGSPPQRPPFGIAPREGNGAGMRRLILGLSMVFLLGTSGGCSPKVQKPSLFHPGPAEYQRQNAVIHDPYPLDDVGPPIVGGRPRGFQKPEDEVSRARQFSPWSAR